jgi:hypothetical protein
MTTDAQIITKHRYEGLDDRWKTIQLVEDAEDGLLNGMNEVQLIQLIGKPPSFRNDREIHWDMHPHAWDGEIILQKNGEIVVSKSQAGST